jgi:hypothetical protein
MLLYGLRWWKEYRDLTIGKKWIGHKRNGWLEMIRVLSGILMSSLRVWSVSDAEYIAEYILYPNMLVIDS